MMPEWIERKIRQAQRRINGIRAAEHGVWVWLAVALAACGVLLACRLWGWEIPEVGLLATGIFLTGVVTAVWGWVSGIDRVEAALRLDQELGLKERLSTLACLSPADLNEPAGQALLHESADRVKEIDVAMAFPWRVPRRAWVSALPAVIYLAIALGIGPLHRSPLAAGEAATPEERERIDTQVTLLEQQAKAREKELREEGGSEELAAINAEIEKAASDLKKNTKGTVDQAALKLSDLAESLERKQEKSEAIDKIKRSLAGLSKESAGGAQELQEALRSGDFKKAAEAMAAMKKELTEGKLDAQAKEELAAQLKRMEEQLKKASSMSKQASELQKNLSPAEANEAMEQLSKQAGELKSLEQLADSLGGVSKSLADGSEQSSGSPEDGQKNGEPKSGSSKESMKKSLDQAEKLLGEMARDDAERKMVGQMLREVGECRGGVCREGQPGQEKDPLGSGGRGKSSGRRPEEEEETRSRMSKASSPATSGKTFVSGKGGTSVFGGESQAEIREAVAAARREADEAITRQPIPPEYRDHAREYFDRLNDEKVGK